MRKLMALFIACLMAAAMMVPALAADVEEVPEIVIEIDGEEGIELHNGYNCTCGGALEQYGSPYTSIQLGTKYPNRMCRHNNPQHMVTDRYLVTTTRYYCNNCNQRQDVTTRQYLGADCNF